uniref:Putative QueT transporter family protein n=1 Tax=viral metagenome TaxID=1070528 RepID=A0A6M3M712_9ZZZZ
MKTREVVLVAVVAALYAVLTVAIAPLSYGPVQFRASEVLKVLVLFDPWLSLGIGIGTFFANMASPFVGPWELVWMPLTDVVGALLAWTLYRACGRRWPWVSCLLYAVLTGLSVATMLTMLGLGGFWLLALSVGASEAIVLTAGLGMFKAAGAWLPHRR